MNAADELKRLKELAEKATPAREGFLCLNGWAGRTETRVLVIGETPKRYRIKGVQARTRLAGRCRWIARDETELVPKHSVRVAAIRGEKP